MKTLLRIDASARAAGSYSRALADYVQERWQQTYPAGQIIVRDLAGAPVPHLDQATIAAFQAATPDVPPSPNAALALSTTLIDELRAADLVLLSTPLYNFNVPSPLKAYFDHVVRTGQTIDAEAVTRFLQRVWHKDRIPDLRATATLQWFNGTPGLLLYEQGTLLAALCLDVDQGLIQRIYAVRNPGKLVALRQRRR